MDEQDQFDDFDEDEPPNEYKRSKTVAPKQIPSNVVIKPNVCSIEFNMSQNSIHSSFADSLNISQDELGNKGSD